MKKPPLMSVDATLLKKSSSESVHVPRLHCRKIRSSALTPPRVRRPHEMHLQEDPPTPSEPTSDHIPREILASIAGLSWSWVAMKGIDTCFMQVVYGMLLYRRNR